MRPWEVQVGCYRYGLCHFELSTCTWEMDFKFTLRFFWIVWSSFAAITGGTKKCNIVWHTRWIGRELSDSWCGADTVIVDMAYSILPFHFAQVSVIFRIMMAYFCFLWFSKRVMKCTKRERKDVVGVESLVITGCPSQLIKCLNLLNLVIVLRPWVRVTEHDMC